MSYSIMSILTDDDLSLRANLYLDLINRYYQRYFSEIKLEVEQNPTLKFDFVRMLKEIPSKVVTGEMISFIAAIIEESENDYQLDNCLGVLENWNLKKTISLINLDKPKSEWLKNYAAQVIFYIQRDGI